MQIRRTNVGAGDGLLRSLEAETNILVPSPLLCCDLTRACARTMRTIWPKICHCNEVYPLLSRFGRGAAFGTLFRSTQRGSDVGCGDKRRRDTLVQPS